MLICTNCGKEVKEGGAGGCAIVSMELLGVVPGET
jgi:hypothetical protein